MNVIAVQSAQNALIQQIQQVNDITILEKVKQMLRQEMAYAMTEEAIPEMVCDEGVPYKTRAEVMADLEDAFRTAEEARKGNIKGRPIEKLLNEL